MVDGYALNLTLAHCRLTSVTFVLNPLSLSLCLSLPLSLSPLLPLTPFLPLALSLSLSLPCARWREQLFSALAYTYAIATHRPTPRPAPHDTCLGRRLRRRLRESECVCLCVCVRACVCVCGLGFSHSLSQRQCRIFFTLARKHRKIRTFPKLQRFKKFKTVYSSYCTDDRSGQEGVGCHQSVHSGCIS